MKSQWSLPSLLLPLVLGAVALAPREAEAGLALAVEAGPTVVVNPKGPEGRTGFGFAGRLGYALSLPVLELTPELKVAVDRMPLSVDVSSVRAMVGGRLAIGAVLTPVVFAHIGYGSISGSEAGFDFKSKGAALDIGAGLDFTLLPVLDFGAYASYNRVLDDGARVHWIQIGLQAGLKF